MSDMGRTELCQWLRDNSSGIYQPAADAADEIEMLAAAKDQHFTQAMENGSKANELRAALERLIACYSVSHSPKDRLDAWEQARAAVRRVA